MLTHGEPHSLTDSAPTDFGKVPSGTGGALRDGTHPADASHLLTGVVPHLPHSPSSSGPEISSSTNSGPLINLSITMLRHARCTSKKRSALLRSASPQIQVNCRHVQRNKVGGPPTAVCTNSLSLSAMSLCLSSSIVTPAPPVNTTPTFVQVQSYELRF